jgi:prophage tail gpP-like protein
MKIKINGRFYNFFNNIAVNYKLDSVASTFSFSGRFDPSNELHKSIFKPLAYHKVEIFSNAGKLLLTGSIVNTSLGSDSKRELQQLSGYSKAGILEDITIPVSAYPLEKLNVNLEDLTASVLNGFDIDFVIDSTVINDMQIVYPKTVAQPSETIKNYIAKLAAQRHIVLSHNEKGDLVFFKPNVKSKPVLLLTEENTLTMGLSVNGQALHSEISVIRQPSKGNSSLSAVDTITNDMVKKKRTLVKVLSSGSETETKKAADNVLAEQLKNISFTAVLNRIEDVKVGDIVEVINPEIYLYNRAKLVISSMIIKESSVSDEMSMNLVLPETFSGETPKNIFE